MKTFLKMTNMEMMKEKYNYSYLFAYRLEIPECATSIKLPDSRFVRIFAMSVRDEGSARALQSPFKDLHLDKEFNERFDRPEAIH